MGDDKADPFATDPFMELVAAAMGTFVPSRGAMLYANRLANEYGEQRTMLAICRVMQEQRVPRHETFSAVEQLLEYAATRDELLLDAAKQREIAEAKSDRQRRDMEYLRDMGRNAPSDPRPLSEIVDTSAWRVDNGADEDEERA